MVAAKTKKKKASRKPGKQPLPWKIFIAIGVFFFMLGGLAVFFILKSQETIKSGGIIEFVADEPIPYEELSIAIEPVIIERQNKKERILPSGERFGAERDKPHVAILIDDMGYNRETCEALLDLDMNLSFAFLPFGPYAEQQADRANRLGRDVLLHFPMEASNPKWHPDKHTVTIDMSRSKIGGVFAANLAAVPNVVGINNHMGSRFTQNERAMRDFLALVRKRGLFFLDSRTSPNSVGEDLASRMGIRTSRRDVFLDNSREVKAIVVQLRKLLELAERQGAAIAIGHPYPETLRSLRFLRREIRQRVKVVGVGGLVK